jgi:hypothetical protein
MFDDQQHQLTNAIVLLQTAQEQLQKAEWRGFVRAVRSLRKVYQTGTSKGEEYPVVPLPSLTIARRTYGRYRDDGMVPDMPGVYFIWKDEKVVYVGTARILSRRLLGGHEHARNGDQCSWLVITDDTKRVCAEAWYIGLLQPERNIAGMLAMWGRVS